MFEGKASGGKRGKENTIWRTKVFAAYKNAIAMPFSQPHFRPNTEASQGYCGLVTGAYTTVIDLKDKMRN